MLLLSASCGNQLSETELGWLEGYWEIEEVVGPDGRSREYGLNATIDYFSLEGMRGYRKKVQPQIDGTFITSDDAVRFELHPQEGQILMLYRHGEEAWEEQLIALDSMAFTVRNTDNISYHYKRYQPLVTHE